MAFTIQGHQLCARLNLSRRQLINLSDTHLKAGTDFETLKNGRRAFTEAAAERLAAALGTPAAASNGHLPSPTPPALEKTRGGAPEWLPATITRLEFPNPRIIAAFLGDHAPGDPILVLIHPDWRPLFHPGMRVQVQSSGPNAPYTTRQPRARGLF